MYVYYVAMYTYVHVASAHYAVSKYLLLIYSLTYGNLISKPKQELKCT